jgi:uncharacterized protein YjiS (DUF1127 family)
LSRIDIDVAKSRQGREWTSGIARIVKSVRATTSRWRDRVRYRRALARLSERELIDIGICWSQIAEEASKPFWRA